MRKPLYVLAGSIEQAVEWFHHDPAHDGFDMRYVDDVRKLMSLRDEVVLLVGTYYERIDFKQAATLLNDPVRRLVGATPRRH